MTTEGVDRAEALATICEAYRDESVRPSSTRMPTKADGGRVRTDHMS